MRGELAYGLAMGDMGERAVCARGASDAVIGVDADARLPIRGFFRHTLRVGAPAAVTPRT